MIEDHWPRLGAIDLQQDGRLGAIWIARDPIADVAHLYDAALFEREVEVVIAHGINARGRKVPVAWEKKAKAMSDALIKLGCNMMPEPCDDDDAMAEVISRNIWARMRASRFRVDRSLSEWLTEYGEFRRNDSRIPKDGFPLMAATRYAVTMFDYARAIERTGMSRRDAYPKVAVV